MPTDLLQLCIRIASQKSVRYLGIFSYLYQNINKAHVYTTDFFESLKLFKANDIFYCSMQARHLWESNDLRWAIHVTINLPGY